MLRATRSEAFQLVNMPNSVRLSKKAKAKNPWIDKIRR